MEIQITEKKQVEIEIIKERYTECDKCRTRVTSSLEFEGGFDLDGNYKKIELCKKCTKEFLKLLEDNGYRVTVWR